MRAEPPQGGSEAVDEILARANRSMIVDRYGAAIRDLEAVCAREGAPRKAFDMLVGAYGGAYMPDREIDTLRRCLAAFPEHLHFSLELADRLVDSGEIAEAAALLEAVRLRMPAIPTAGAGDTAFAEWIWDAYFRAFEQLNTALDRRGDTLEQALAFRAAGHGPGSRLWNWCSHQIGGLLVRCGRERELPEYIPDLLRQLETLKYALAECGRYAEAATVVARAAMTENPRTADRQETALEYAACLALSAQREEAVEMFSAWRQWAEGLRVDAWYAVTDVATLRAEPESKHVLCSTRPSLAFRAVERCIPSPCKEAFLETLDLAAYAERSEQIWHEYQRRYLLSDGALTQAGCEAAEGRARKAAFRSMDTDWLERHQDWFSPG